MASEEPDYEKSIESGHLGEPSEYDRQSYHQIEESQHYRADENVGELDPSGAHEDLRREEFLKRKALRFEMLKKDYKFWDEERNWRPFTILPRDWWKAAAPSHSAPLHHPVNLVILTFSHSRTCHDTYHCSREAKRVQNDHIRNGAIDVIYNFMIGGNGQVIEGRGWHSAPRLLHRLQRHSRNALHIAFLGNLRGVLPSDEMFQSARDLMAFGVRKKYIAPKFLEYTTKLWTIPRMGTDSEILNNLGNN